jgi:hypothetical protein
MDGKDFYRVSVYTSEEFLEGVEFSSMAEAVEQAIEYMTDLPFAMVIIKHSTTIINKKDERAVN